MGPERGRLFVSVGDSSLGQIVWGQFHGDAITGENADSVSAEFASEVGENGAVRVDFDAEKTAGELFDYGASHFNAIFFAH